MQRAEDSIEIKFKKDLYAWARTVPVTLECLKFRVSGFNGWPDRLILWGGGNSMFIEFKQPGGEYQPLQPYVIERLKSLGFTIEVHDDAAIALESAKGKILSTLGTNAGHDADRKKQRLQALFATWKGENCDCAEGVFRIEGPKSCRCVTCHRTLKSDSHLMAQPIGTVGGLFSFVLCDNPRG